MSVFREDFFAVEQPLLARLRETAPLAKAVLSMADIEEGQEKSQITPAIHVVFHGFSINGDEVEQIWLVVAVTKNLKQATAAAGNTARIDSDSGRLIVQIINGLRGFCPVPDESQPFRAISPPSAVYQNGFMYTPTAWTVKFTYTRERGF